MARKRMLFPTLEHMTVYYERAELLPHPRIEMAWLYIFSQGESPVYVGVTNNNLGARVGSHRRTQPWWADVDSVTAIRTCCRHYAGWLEPHVIEALGNRLRNRSYCVPVHADTSGHGVIGTSVLELRDDKWVCV